MVTRALRRRHAPDRARRLRPAAAEASGAPHSSRSSRPRCGGSIRRRSATILLGGGAARPTAAERRDHVRDDRDGQRRRLRRPATRRGRGPRRRRRRDPRAGPMLLRAYRDGSDPLVDGWFATGDVGRWLDDGRLHVDGRRAELIITGGENVWPAAVEAVLRGPRGSPTSPSSVRTTPNGVRRSRPSWCRPAPAPTLDELRDAVKSSCRRGARRGGSCRCRAAAHGARQDRPAPARRRGSQPVEVVDDRRLAAVGSPPSRGRLMFGVDDRRIGAELDEQRDRWAGTHGGPPRAGRWCGGGRSTSNPSSTSKRIDSGRPSSAARATRSSRCSRARTRRSGSTIEGVVHCAAIGGEAGADEPGQWRDRRRSRLPPRRGARRSRCCRAATAPSYGRRP